MSNRPTNKDKSKREYSHQSTHQSSTSSLARHAYFDTDLSKDTSRDEVFSLDSLEDDENTLAREDIGPRTIGRRRDLKHARDGKGKSPLLSADYGESESSEEQSGTTSTIARLPTEVLSRILANVDPVTLLRSTSVCRTFAAVVKDEATWRLAFALAFRVVDEIGLTPVFRRIDIGSWKAEHTKRLELLRRWRRARSPTVICEPRISTIHAIALSVPHHFLLSVSEAFGVASRCDPFTGKVTKGFIDASGQLNGIGLVGQQQQLQAIEQQAGQEISSIALESDASRIIWGYQSGEIGMTILARQGSNPRGWIKGVRLSSRGSHNGSVLAIAMPYGTARGGAHSIERSPEKLKQKQAQLGEVADVFATAGMDGTVRLWSARKALPIWIDVAQHQPVASLDRVYKRPDPVMCLEMDIESGSIAAATAEGEITIWTGIDIANLCNLPYSAFDESADLQLSAASMQANFDRKTLLKGISRINLPRARVRGEDGGMAPSVLVFDMILVTADIFHARLLVHCQGGNSFERFDITKKKGQEAIITSSLFVSPDEVKITVLRPDFDLATSKKFSNDSPPSTAQFSEQKYVCAGTSEGTVIIWDWNAGEGQDVIQAWCTLNGHHASITAIDVNAHIIAIGCSDGTIKAFCPLTGQHVRTFNDRTATRHPARMLAAGELTEEEASRYHVSQVIVGPDTLVASIGGQILAWRAEKLKSKNSRNVVTASRVSSGKSNVGPLWDPKLQSQKEMEQDVFETKQQLQREQREREEEYERIKYSVGGRSELEIGDLNEQEAFEYAMMLSRDEEEAKQRRTIASNNKAEELQDALEQVAMAESAEEAAPRQGKARAISEEDDKSDEHYLYTAYATSASISPISSPSLSALSSPPSRAWDILQQAGSSALPASRNQDRWRPNNKVSIIQVPRSARMSSGQSSASISRRSSSNQTPTISSTLPISTPPKLDSPRDWPMIESSSYSRSPGNWHLGSPLNATTSSNTPSLQLSQSMSSSAGGPSPTLAPIKSPIGAWAGGSPSLRPIKDPDSSASASQSQYPSALTKSKPVSLVPKQDEDIDDDLKYVLELSLAEEQSRLKK